MGTLKQDRQRLWSPLKGQLELFLGDRFHDDWGHTAGQPGSLRYDLRFGVARKP